ncbi:ATP-binding protein [Sulfurimonas sp. HSL3-7]|uniref:sensor histidine kinase n=1 Tax=Sulfonitrofixus jiaomeiensis TaxID=3131938 RepID=UPI0031F9F7FD
MTAFKKRFLLFINSGSFFNENEQDLKIRHNIINITIMLALSGLVFGTTLNLMKADYLGAVVDIAAIFILSVTAFFLHLKKEYFEFIASIFATEFLLLFTLLIVISEPSDLKHIWLLTYPALIFFYKGDRSWLLWIGLLITSLFVAKIQPFYPIQYSLRDIIYLSVVLTIMTVVVYVYKSRIDLANKTITEQKDRLEGFTKELECTVKEKTKELQQLNAQLELKVEEKVKELIRKDEMILAQSRQAAMGEMISMIAHQWRQPLSTITLQISNIKINAMLGKASVEETNDALERISETIIYLSETIDDFQRFFHPNKGKEVTTVCELIEHAVSFAEPRLKVAHIKLDYSCRQSTEILIHSNEFTQVIINIINNAVDALLEHKVENPQIKIESLVNKENIEVHIYDNGGGIENDIFNNIFEPYFSTKGKNGTGLGLYMSKMIIEKEMDGSLEARNSGNGAEFIIKMPLVDLIPSEEAKPEQVESTGDILTY